MSLSPELSRENDHPDQQSCPEIGLGNLEATTDCKLHKEHQCYRQNCIYHGCDHGLPAGFDVGFHSVPLVREVKRSSIH